MAEPPRLYGLKALVTGAAAGIGEAVVRTLVRHGADVFAADGANSGIEQQFRKVRGVTKHVVNLVDPARIPAVVEAAHDVLGGIDIVVADFPQRPEKPIAEIDAAFDRLLESRAALIMSLCRSALPHLRRSPAGRIVSIGMLRTLFAAGAEGAYARAEADLAALTRALAAEIGADGIAANYVQPGAIMTPVSRDVFRKDRALRDYCIARSAAGRLGEPVDVAKVVLFLASEDAAFVSGTGIVVDGGRSAD